MRVLKAFIPGLGVALALLLFAVALGLVQFGRVEPMTVGGPAMEPASPGDPDPALVRALETAKRRIRALESEIGQLEAAAAPSPDASANGAGEPGDAPPEPEIPEKVRAAAAVVGVSESALAAAYRLEMATRNRTAAPGALEAFLAEGADGFRAVVALMRAGFRATWQKQWLEKTWEPGLEQVLIDYIEDPEQAGQAEGALACLSVADNRRVRDYLVQKVRDHPTPMTVYCAAQALGDLKEPRGANAIGLVFAQPDWGGVRGTIIHNLGEMGGVDARRILIDYVRLENADQLAPAIAALKKIDPAAARLEAKRLLSREGAEFMDFRDRSALKKVAEEE